MTTVTVSVTMGPEQTLVQKDLSKDEITFTGKLREPVHNWYRMTASFSPVFVRKRLRELNPDQVLDPFAGVGTTLVESRRGGIESLGIELNPVLKLVAETKATVEPDDAERGRDRLSEVRERYEDCWDDYDTDTLAAFEDSGGDIPNLSNIERWWTWENLSQLLCLRDTIWSTLSGESEALQGLFNIGLIKTAMRVSNAGAGRVSLSFLDEPLDKKPVLSLFSKTLRQMTADVLLVFSPEDTTQSHVLRGDSTNLGKVVDTQSQFDCVITSPPYPNRFTYTRETRPPLYLLNIFHDPADAGKLDLISIGGTWGRAWSTVDRGEIGQVDDTVRECLGQEILDELESADEGMANYCLKYFRDLWLHLREVTAFLSPAADIQYVVGNSRLKGVEIPTDIILSKLMQEAGFDLNRIERVRRRHSKKDLYEAVVVAERPA